MSRFFFDSAAATPITATMRNRWTGLNSSQATASSRLKPPPTALAELASSALTSLPWRDTQAIRFGGAGTGQVCCAKPLVESRRGDGEENGARDTRAGGKAAWAAKPKPRSSSAASSMNEERDQEERDWSDRFIGFERSFLAICVLRKFFWTEIWEGKHKTWKVNVGYFKSSTRVSILFLLNSLNKNKTHIYIYRYSITELLCKNTENFYPFKTQMVENKLV